MAAKAYKGLASRFLQALLSHAKGYAGLAWTFKDVAEDWL